MNRHHDKAFTTRAVHMGERLDLPGVNPVVSAIHPSVSYIYADSRELDAVLGEEKPGFVYSSRYANPTITAFEMAIANLEGAETALAFSSGMAAVHMALLGAGLRAGKAIVAAADVYGATYSLLQNIFKELGAEVHLVDVLDLNTIEKTVSKVKPVALFVETISNPLMKVADLPRFAQIAHAADALFLVDNTFTTPTLCNPIKFGADMVIHSATKYLSGHGDVMAGVVATSAKIKKELVRLNKLIGSSMGPFEAWLTLRGLKTLPLRVQQQCRNALALAKWLKEHPKVERVYYADLTDHPQHGLMQKLTEGKGAGGVLSFEVKSAGREQVFAFMDALELIQPATSLGDIYSLVLYPTISSHRTLTLQERAAVGIGENLLRISVGIEDIDDIKRDVAQALDKI